jgi:hypothetical protein
LEFDDRERVVIGDFHGDPEIAIIDADQKWCTIGGCGLIIYFLEEPFENFLCEKISNQYQEIGCAAPDTLWVKSIKQVGVSEIQITLESGETRTLKIAKICQ